MKVSGPISLPTGQQPGEHEEHRFRHSQPRAVPGPEEVTRPRKRQLDKTMYMEVEKSIIKRAALTMPGSDEGTRPFLARPNRPGAEEDTTEADVENLKARLRQLSGTWISCQSTEDSFQDWMAWCIDWLQHRFNHLSCITEEMAPLGLRK